jgi:chromosome segregation ATPase
VKWSEADFADAQAMAQCRTELASLQALIDEHRASKVTLHANRESLRSEFELNKAKIANTATEIADAVKAQEVLANNIAILNKERARFHAQYLQRLADAKR